MKIKKIEYGIIGLILLALIGVAWAIDESITVSFTPIVGHGIINSGLIDKGGLIGGGMMGGF